MADPRAPFGIVAGGGPFPVLCAKAAHEAGREVVCVAHTGETTKDIVPYCDQIKWIHLGQLGKLIKFLKEAGCKECLFAGTIKKKRIFYDVRPDIRALALWRRIGPKLDDSILRAISDELEKEGIQVVPSTYFLKGLFMPEGVLTKRAPTKEEMEDIEFGFYIQKKIGALDIGQTVVVKSKTVLAVEAMEGTDETIFRGGRLAHGSGCVVVKVAKPHQDMRFDVPSAGLATIETMIDAGVNCLALEAGKSLFFDRDVAVALADQHKISIIGVNFSEDEGGDGEA